MKRTRSEHEALRMRRSRQDAFSEFHQTRPGDPVAPDVEVVRNDIPMNILDTQNESIDIGMITTYSTEVSVSDSARNTGGIAPHLAEGTITSESMSNEVYRALPVPEPHSAPNIVDSPRPSTFVATNENTTEQPISDEDNPWIGRS